MSEKALKLVSFGIAARNEQKTIERAVRQLLAQQLPKGHEAEVIVAANACTDRTAELVRKISEKDARVKLFETSEGGKPKAMNLIARKARGETLIFCDAVIALEKQAALKVLNALAQQPGILGIGVAISPLLRRYPSWMERMDAARKKTSPRRGKRVFDSLSASEQKIPKYVINEDEWLSRKLGLYDTKALQGVSVNYNVPTNLMDYWRSLVRWETGALQLREMGVSSPRPGQFRQRFERFKKIGFLEKLWVLPSIPLFLLARLAAKGVYERRQLQRGWKSPARK